jgi:hypothetical protein
LAYAAILSTHEISSKYISTSLAFGWICVRIRIQCTPQQEYLSSLASELRLSVDIVDFAGHP